MAGVTAAIAAARQGARTILIERHAVLGGTATACGVGSFCGETRGQGEVFDDIIDRLLQLDAIVAYRPYEEMEARAFDHQILPLVLQELALESGVKLLLHTWFVDVECDDSWVEHVVVLGKSGLEVIRPKFVIDCTGDADVVNAAGLPTFKGRGSNDRQLPMSLMFFMRDVRSEVDTLLPQGCEWLEKEDLPFVSAFTEDAGPAPGPSGRAWARGGNQPLEFGEGALPKLAVKMKVIGYDATDSRDLSAAEVFARRRMFSVVHYLQRTRYATYRYDHAAIQIGIREGRRVQGEYVLTQQDVKAGRRFEDGIALGTFYLDAWDPDTDKKAYIPDEQGAVLSQPPPYHIPFRCLRPKGSRNLLVAGRCLSADQLALSSARVMTTASMMGQAAGIAAAMCIERGQDSATLNVQHLHSALIERRAKLL